MRAEEWRRRPPMAGQAALQSKGEGRERAQLGRGKGESPSVVAQ